MSSLPFPPLNVMPEGLLGFLQLKNGGRNPQHLGVDLAPVLDLLAWYQNTNSQEVQLLADTINVSTPSGFLPWTGTVPSIPNWPAGSYDNEYLLILEYEVSWSLPVSGDTADFAPAASIAESNLALPTYLSGYTTGSSVARAGSRALARPFWLKPGGNLNLRTFGVVTAAGGIAVGGRIRYCRLKV